MAEAKAEGKSQPEKTSKPHIPGGFEFFRKSVLYMTGLGMTEDDKQQFLKEAALRHDEKECKKCYEMRDWMLKYSPTVRFMSEQISKVGGNINASNIVCDKCDEMKSGGFHPKLGILLCQNKIYGKWHLEDTLAHEMVHAYDECRFNVDWSDLRHHACSEIRASTLSGECRMMNQIVRNGIFMFSKGLQNCVRRRATLSVRANPNCQSDEQAAKVVNEVFDSCFSDTRPFDEIYR